MPPCSQTLPPESSWANLVRQASARRNLFTRWTTFADNQGESISLREQLTSSGNGEAERFVRSQNPNLDDFGPAAFFRVGSVRHWRERADFDGNGDGVRTFGRLGVKDAVALHRAKIALRSPISEKILRCVRRAGLPELVGFRSIARNERVEETLRGLLFRVVAKREPQCDNRDHCKRRDGKGHGPGFIWFIGRWIEK